MKNLSQTEPKPNTIFFEKEVKKSPKIRKTRKDCKEPLLVNCLICDFSFEVKYVFSKKRHSLKNNWGYWTGKETDLKKYFCDNCFWKIHSGSVNDWILNEKRVRTFYSYIDREKFGKKEF